jgi:hypothetical protein
MADNINSFLKKQNIETLWDVISEEEIFKFLSKDIQSQISDMFISNIKGFFEVERNKTNNLVDINKKYILLILNYIKNTFPQNLPNKIKIFNDEPVSKELITYEEIQNEKKTQFEKELSKVQEEFNNSMSLPVPEKPDFADKYSDNPISEMDKMIKEITAKRNYDVEQINRNYQTNINQADNWLKSQETSVKAEKLNPDFQSATNFQSDTSFQSEINTKFKYLNFNDQDSFNDNINDNYIVQKELKKNVSWGKNEEITQENSLSDEIMKEYRDIEEIKQLENNLFNKLKKVNNTPTQNIHLSIEEPVSLEDRIKKIETMVESYNTKFDLLFNLLKK